jgi:hypothetical protein
MSPSHHQAAEAATGADDHSKRARSADDDVDCCDVCATPLWVVGPIVISLGQALPQ